MRLPDTVVRVAGCACPSPSRRPASWPPAAPRPWPAGCCGPLASGPVRPGPPSEWTTFDQNGLRTGVDTSGTSFSPATAAWTSPDPRRRALRAAAASTTAGCSPPPRTTRSTPWPPTAGPCCGPTPRGHAVRPVDGPWPLRRHPPDGGDHRHAGHRPRPVARSSWWPPSRSGAARPPPRRARPLHRGRPPRRGDRPAVGASPAYELQRASLALTDGRVIVGFGGNSGDCEPYHGLVVRPPRTGRPRPTFVVADQPGDSQGAVWMGGAAPDIDAQGDIWVATGNSAATSRPPTTRATASSN